MIRAEAERVFIEHCINCFQHTWCTNHDENKYKDCFVKCKESILRTCDNVSVCENVVPVGLENDFIVSPNVNKPGKVHFPRIGSFEIFFRGRCIFSKLNSMKWPNPSQIAEKLKEIQEAPQKTGKKRVENRNRSTKPMRKIIKNNPIKVKKKKDSQEFVYEKIESLIKERKKRVKRFSELFEKEKKKSRSSSGDSELEGFSSHVQEKKGVVVEKSQERLQKKELKEFFGEIKSEGQRLAEEARGKMGKNSSGAEEKEQNGPNSLFSSSDKSSSEDEVVELETKGFEVRSGQGLGGNYNEEVEVKGQDFGGVAGEKLDKESDKEKRELLEYREDKYSSDSEESGGGEGSGSCKNFGKGGLEANEQEKLKNSGESESEDKSSENKGKLGEDLKEKSSNSEVEYKDDYENKDSKELSGDRKQGSDSSKSEENSIKKEGYSKSNSENEENYGNDFYEKDSEKSEKSNNYSEKPDKNSVKSNSYSEGSVNKHEKSDNSSENPEKYSENPENDSKDTEKYSENSEKYSENPYNDSENQEKYSENPDNESENQEKYSENPDNESENSENYSEDNEEDSKQDSEENELVHPLKPISKSFEITLKVGMESRKKITYENISGKSSMFIVKSSNSSLMSIKDKELQIDEGVKEKIQLTFAPFYSECEKKFYIYIDKDGEHWECIEIVANYTN